MTQWLDLRALPDDRWRSMTLPDSQPAVDLVRLHVDRDTGASLSLVRFPAGWERPEPGCYPVGEELVVVDGALEVSGVTFSAGDHGWVPPRVVRSGSRSPDGALVLAMFTGPPEWHTAAGERRPGDVVRTPVHLGPLRQATDEDGAGGWSVVVDEVTPVAEHDRDLFDVTASRWALVPAGATAPEPATPEGLVVVRTWP